MSYQIRKDGDKWTVSKLDGIECSKSFDTMSEAIAWAHEVMIVA